MNHRLREVEFQDHTRRYGTRNFSRLSRSISERIRVRIVQQELLRISFSSFNPTTKLTYRDGAAAESPLEFSDLLCNLLLINDFAVFRLHFPDHKETYN